MSASSDVLVSGVRRLGAGPGSGLVCPFAMAEAGGPGECGWPQALCQGWAGTQERVLRSQVLDFCLPFLFLFLFFSLSLLHAYGEDQTLWGKKMGHIWLFIYIGEYTGDLIQPDSVHLPSDNVQSQVGKRVYTEVTQYVE